MQADPASTVAAVLRHIERCRRKGVPVRARHFAGGAVVMGEEAGVVKVAVATNGHAWRLRVFAAANRYTVDVNVDPEAVE